MQKTGRAIVFRPDGKVLVVCGRHRTDVYPPREWFFPEGSVEPPGGPAEAAERGLLEKVALRGRAGLCVGSVGHHDYYIVEMLDNKSQALVELAFFLPVEMALNLVDVDSARMLRRAIRQKV